MYCPVAAMCRSDASKNVHQARRDRWTVVNLQHGLNNSLKSCKFLPNPTVPSQVPRGTERASSGLINGALGVAIYKRPCPARSIRDTPCKPLEASPFKELCRDEVVVAYIRSNLCLQPPRSRLLLSLLPCPAYLTRKRSDRPRRVSFLFLSLLLPSLPLPTGASSPRY